VELQWSMGAILILDFDCDACYRFKVNENVKFAVPKHSTLSKP
jgi:hypothetical protein